MKNWLSEIVTVGGMTGTRAEYIEHLQAENGWTLAQAVEIACYAKGAK